MRRGSARGAVSCSVFTILLVVAGVFCVFGVASYLFVVGRVEPLSAKRDDAIDERAYARHS
jgi:MFS transporter, ACS family, D-galactonate transporter